MLRGPRLGSAGFRFACSLPLLGLSLSMAAVRAGGRWVFRLFHLSNRAAREGAGNWHACDEFEFENAVRAYEDEIDAHVRRQL